MSDVTIPAEITVPTGDANVIRSLQQFLDLARAGKIQAVAVVGVDMAGNVMSSNTLPQNAAIMHIAMGALQGLIITINSALSAFMKPIQTSQVIRPGMIR